MTLEGYAVEGGLDQPGGPATCYAPTIALGRHVGPGAADDLWHRYEDVLNFIPALGFDGVRLTIEWARVEPRPGWIDEAALARYGEVLRHARSLDLLVTLAVVDAAWPSWLGQEAWLLPWVVPHVIAQARRLVERFSRDLTGVVLFAQPRELVANGFLRATAPPWRRSALREASFANAQIARLNEVLRRDEMVGPTLTASSAVIALGQAPRDLARARASLEVQEIYVRSLLRGRGPTSVAQGLLVQEGGEWRVNAPAELLDVLR